MGVILPPRLIATSALENVTPTVGVQLSWESTCFASTSARSNHSILCFALRTALPTNSEHISSGVADVAPTERKRLIRVRQRLFSPDLVPKSRPSRTGDVPSGIGESLSFAVIVGAAVPSRNGLSGNEAIQLS